MTFSYNENTGRYRIENAEIKYPNFEGLESQYNRPGQKNFKVVIDEELATELQDQGIRIAEVRRRDDTEPQRYTVKVGVYGTSTMFLVCGNVKMPVKYEDAADIDKEFRNGYVRNGKVDVKFHVSVNNRLNPPTPYLRLDSIYIPVDEDEQAEKYRDYETVNQM